MKIRTKNKYSSPHMNTLPIDQSWPTIGQMIVQVNNYNMHEFKCSIFIKFNHACLPLLFTSLSCNVSRSTLRHSRNDSIFHGSVLTSIVNGRVLAGTHNLWLLTFLAAVSYSYLRGSSLPMDTVTELVDVYNSSGQPLLIIVFTLALLFVVTVFHTPCKMVNSSFSGLHR